jgi:hypothetical protein
MNGVEIIKYIFKRSIRAEVVNYRLDVVFESLHMPQLNGFAELRNDQAVIRYCTASTKKTMASL